MKKDYECSSFFCVFLISFLAYFTSPEYEISFVKIESTGAIKRYMPGQKIDLYCVEVKEETIL